MNNRAFTLIEISVVLVILGIIAVMSFPAIFGQIERQNAQEAISTLKAIGLGIENCGFSQIQNIANGSRINPGDFTLCNSWSAISISDPSLNAVVKGIPTNTSANFTYHRGTNVNIIDDGINNNNSAITNFGVGTYTIVATRVGTGDTITIVRNPGSNSCTGTGAYVGVCS